MSELVSIIVPCYNVEGTVRRCLASIAAQTHDDFEALCVNDGSTDDTLATLEDFASRDGRFRVIDKANGGYGAACNRGLDEARGEWIAIVEPDDTVRPRMLEAMLAFAEETEAASGTTVEVVKCPYWTVLPSEDGCPKGRSLWQLLLKDRMKRQSKSCHKDRPFGHPSSKAIPCRYFGRVHPARQPFRVEEAPRLLKHRPSIWSALYRTSFLRENGIRFVEAPGAGWTDNPFLYDTLLRARAIAYLDEAFYEYREEDPAKTAAFARNHPEQVIARLNEMADIVDALDVEDPGVLGAHAKRTVNYLRILADNGATQEAMAQVARRLDPATVWAEPELPRRNKQLFARLIGQPLPHLSPLPRLRARAEEAAWALRHAR